MDYDQFDLLDEEFDDIDNADSLTCLLAEYESYSARRTVASCIDGVAWSDGGAA